MEYLSRICFNSEGWRRPTGEAQYYELSKPHSFSKQFGYGHEEWLFRFDWQIDGWQYGFLQGVNSSRSTLAGMDEAVDVTLYTCEPGRKRRYVAKILDVECLSHDQSDAVYDVFSANGWLDEMRSEILAIGGNVSKLGDPKWVHSMINVRFRQQHVHWYEADTYAQEGEYVLTLKRYQFNLIRDASQIPFTDLVKRSRNGGTVLPNQLSYFRSGSAGKICSPEHGMIQAKLIKELWTEHPNDEVSWEKDFVDVMVLTPTERILYEIKSDIEPRMVIRLAIGQLLEYGFYGDAVKEISRRTELVVVGRKCLSPEDDAYLKVLQSMFNLPLKYRAVHI